MVKLPQLATIEQVLAEALQGLDFGRSGIAPRSPRAVAERLGREDHSPPGSG
jgi:hypothetical protein